MDFIGQFLGQFPIWMSLMAAFVIVLIGWFLWMKYMDPLMYNETLEQKQKRQSAKKEIK